jgi:hypothetical protein
LVKVSFSFYNRKRSEKYLNAIWNQGGGKSLKKFSSFFYHKKGGIMDSDTRVILCGGLALFTGILLGTGLGLLMAPQTGRRTRRQIKNYLHDTSDRFYDLADESKDRMSEFMDKGKRFVEDRI